MVMPGRRSGLDLVQEIGERWPTLPTMLMTGYSDAAIAAARENISVLRKPYTIERLSTEIQATLRLREGSARIALQSGALLKNAGSSDFPLKTHEKPHPRALAAHQIQLLVHSLARSEEPRGGKEIVHKCRSW